MLCKISRYLGTPNKIATNNTRFWLKNILRYIVVRVNVLISWHTLIICKQFDMHEEQKNKIMTEFRKEDRRGPKIE